MTLLSPAATWLVRSSATPFTRPVAGTPPGSWPLGMGDGPRGVQVEPLSGIELEGTSRDSNISRSNRARGRGRRIVTGRRAKSDENHRRGAGLRMVYLPRGAVPLVVRPRSDCRAAAPPRQTPHLLVRLRPPPPVGHPCRRPNYGR